MHQFAGLLVIRNTPESHRAVEAVLARLRAARGLAVAPEVRARIDGQVYDIDQPPELAPRKLHHIEAVVDRVIIRPGVRSRVGEVDAPVAVSDEIMAGVVSLPHGYGHDDEHARLRVAGEHAGVNSNRLTDEASIDALSGNSVLNGIPVEITPL